MLLLTCTICDQLWSVNGSQYTKAVCNDISCVLVGAQPVKEGPLKFLKDRLNLLHLLRRDCLVQS